ncbi:DUF4397 domain-containing protein [Rathayibacter sp. YIM 133350]|uniref:DUF4397 domain-containing protein n=1 Tax=Rathayibacter sp. YIM 133350 TaxID=3131992 RepID=UPI00307F5037
MNVITLSRRLVAGVVASLAAAGLVALAAAPALAAPTPDTGVAVATADTGWVRVGHLSPDTAAVDVTLSALAGGSTIFQLQNVAYGQVSAYRPLAAGTYVVAMVPAGSPAGTPAVISATVTVTAGQAGTVAAYGPNKNLRTLAFTDDLTSPAAGQSRIRVIQASTKVSDVDVETTSGMPIATDAKAGTATGYASVPVGPWDLKLSAEGVASAAQVSLAPGTVNTLFVLDNASGGLTLMAVLDSSGAGEVPGGSLETGGGYLAHRATDPFALIGRVLSDLFRGLGGLVRLG